MQLIHLSRSDHARLFDGIPNIYVIFSINIVTNNFYNRLKQNHCCPIESLENKKNAINSQMR